MVECYIERNLRFLKYLVVLNGCGVSIPRDKEINNKCLHYGVHFQNVLCKVNLFEFAENFETSHSFKASRP